MTVPVRTAEMRWFCGGAVPAPVAAWFEALGLQPPEEARSDLYLPPTDDALGIKWRPAAGAPVPAALEPKRREAVGAVVRVGRAEAPTETWAKWSVPVARGVSAPDGWVTVEKARRQHRDGAPDAGCALELARLVVAGDAWWSVALEATAPDAAVRERWLLHGASRWLARDDAPALPLADAAGYPAWLRRLAG